MNEYKEGREKLMLLMSLTTSLVKLQVTSIYKNELSQSQLLH